MLDCQICRFLFFYLHPARACLLFNWCFSSISNPPKRWIIFSTSFTDNRTKLSCVNVITYYIIAMLWLKLLCYHYTSCVDFICFSSSSREIRYYCNRKIWFLLKNAIQTACIPRCWFHQAKLNICEIDHLFFIRFVVLPNEMKTPKLGFFKHLLKNI